MIKVLDMNGWLSSTCLSGGNVQLNTEPDVNRALNRCSCLAMYHRQSVRESSER